MSALDGAFAAVLDVSGRASCLILALLACRPWMQRKLSGRMLFAVWIAVAIRLLVPASLPARWSPFSLSPAYPAGLPAGIVAGAEAGPPPSAGVQAPPGNAPKDRRGTADFRGRARAAAMVWAAGVGMLLLARILAWSAFAWKIRRSSQAPSPAVAALADELARRWSLRRVPIAVTDAVGGPALWGVFRPRLLFPPGFAEQLSRGEMELTVAHELAHRLRRDLPARGLIHAACILHWFNPLAWIAARLARQDCELACDECVVGRLGRSAAGAYGAALLKIAGLSRRAALPLGIGVVSTRQSMKRRIEMIAVPKHPALAAAALGGVLAATLTLASFTRAEPADSPGAAPATAADGWIQNLHALFPSGTVATIGAKNITVDEVARQIGIFVPQVRRDAKDDRDFTVKITHLQYEVIQHLVDRELLIQEFRAAGRRIPADFVDQQVTLRIKDGYGGDQARLQRYLEAQHQSMADFRRQVEEDIIFSYMRAQQKKAAAPASATSSPVSPRVHLRMIELARSAGTDSALRAQAEAILLRLKRGERFEDLAKAYSIDQRRERGGDWGWVQPSDLKPQFSQALFALQKGQAAPPIVNQDGCFILYAEDRS